MNVKTILLAAGSSLIASAAVAETYAIDWHAIGAGGTSAGGIYSLRASVGDAVAGQMRGGDYTMDSEFWNDTANAADLIVNGSFENTSATFVADVYGIMSLPVGSTAIPGWTAAVAELAWINNTNIFGGATPFGVHFLDLTGYHDGLPYAGVTQTIFTTPGQKYQLSLSLGSNADYPGAGGQKTVAVCADATCTNFVMIPSNTTGNQWSTSFFNFTADTSSTVVTISGTVASGIYLGLDNVSVIPEPEPEQAPRIIAIEKLGHDLRLIFTSVVGKNYAIQSRTAVESAEWATLHGTNAGTGTLMEATLTNPFTAPQRFYRVWQVP